MANSTMIQIPNNLDDLVTLRRVLTSIVEAIDVLQGNRGTDSAAKSSQLVSTAASISELTEDINSLSNVFIHSDGSNKITGALTYATDISLSGNNLIDYKTAATLDTELEAKLNKMYLELDQQTAPGLLAGNTDVVAISTKVDDIITALINSKLFI